MKTKTKLKQTIIAGSGLIGRAMAQSLLKYKTALPLVDRNELSATEEQLRAHLVATTGIQSERIVIDTRSMDIVIFSPIDRPYNTTFDMSVKYKFEGLAKIKNIQTISDECKNQQVRCVDGDIVIDLNTKECFMLTPTKFVNIEPEDYINMIVGSNSQPN